MKDKGLGGQGETVRTTLHFSRVFRAYERIHLFGIWNFCMWQSFVCESMVCAFRMVYIFTVDRCPLLAKKEFHKFNLVINTQMQMHTVNQILATIHHIPLSTDVL